MVIPFVPIARRDLKFVASPRVSMDVILAVSAPYRPAKDATKGKAACMILDCDDPGLAMEIGGDDELEALALSLIHLEKFIEGLRRSGSGRLLNPDGSEYKPGKASLFAHYLENSKT